MLFIWRNIYTIQFGLLDLGDTVIISYLAGMRLVIVGAHNIYKIYMT